MTELTLTLVEMTELTSTMLSITVLVLSIALLMLTNRFNKLRREGSLWRRKVNGHLVILQTLISRNTDRLDRPHLYPLRPRPTSSPSSKAGKHELN